MAYRYLTLSQLGVISKGQPSYLKHGGKAVGEYAQARAAKAEAGRIRGRLIARNREREQAAGIHEMVSAQQAEKGHVIASQQAQNAANRLNASAAADAKRADKQLKEGVSQAKKAKQIEASVPANYNWHENPVEHGQFSREIQERFARQKEMRAARQAKPEPQAPPAQQKKQRNWGRPVAAGLAATAAGGTGYGAWRYHQSWANPKGRRNAIQV